jgi:hypothetical protein
MFLLIVVALAIGLCTAFAEDSERHFSRCRMEALKNVGYQGQWNSRVDRYLFACMHAAGFDFISEEAPGAHCPFGDWGRVDLPECYQPATEPRRMQHGQCMMDAIKNMKYDPEERDYDGPAARYFYACMRAAGYDLKSQNQPQSFCTGEIRIVLPECYEPAR